MKKIHLITLLKSSPVTFVVELRISILYSQFDEYFQTKTGRIKEWDGGDFSLSSGLQASRLNCTPQVYKLHAGLPKYLCFSVVDQSIHLANFVLFSLLEI